MRDEYTIDAYKDEREFLQAMRRKDKITNKIWDFFGDDIKDVENLFERIEELDNDAWLEKFLDVDQSLVSVALQACEVQEAITQASYENAGEYADEMIKEFKGEFKEGMEEHLKIMIERGMITNGQQQEFQDYFRWYVYP
jgi:uncharacterized protein YutE (UPF0331/DUF86 family)